MSGGSSLPVTGGIAIGSIVIGQTAMVAIGVTAIVLGALLVKATFRRGKSAFEQ